MVSKTDFPSWGHMLRQGATTLWEAWDDSQSLLHSSFLYAGAWFTHGVLGIRDDPQIAGFGRFTIRPGIASTTLHSAAGFYHSIRGRISVEWRWEEGRFELNVDVPPNTRAEVHLPTSRADSARLDGRQLDAFDMVKFLPPSDGRVAIEVGSGRYAFSSELVPPHPMIAEAAALVNVP
jgi:alpha-L-rhamnosidase